ncbi:hypothetical protein [Arthrobacter gengyunqii]|uniref:CobQ/CobB/MinD/ParA nucleotide binding domain-containing protein n=1 Tax=Arthrobacter gengyunqii TaxID=2886940 RepID=A0ABS8GMP4_9MICC|nr:hypothetical protein [Arthrobacter gengyunqii]MCC3266523.1 hypothetical protein [Arthrobacter gengyunqii]
MNQPLPAESVLRRVLGGSADLFRGDDYPRLLAEAAAGTQLPVTTGRRIAVVGSRGGSGRTTVAALLARIYAAMRADGVAAVDLAPEAGTLGLRLGVPDAPALDAVAARLEFEPPASLQQLAGLLAVAGPANLLVTGRRRPHARGAADPWCPAAGSPAAGVGIGAGVGVAAGVGVGTMAPAPAWTPTGPVTGRPLDPVDSGLDGSGANGVAGSKRLLLSRAVSRYCPITVFDCGPGLGAPEARWAVGNSHLAVFVTPATASGFEDAVEYAAAWRRDPLLGSVPLLVLVVQCAKDAALSASRQAGCLRRAGVDALHLGYDRHLEAGVEALPSLLARRTRLEAVSLASRVLSTAVSVHIAQARNIPS